MRNFRLFGAALAILTFALGPALIGSAMTSGEPNETIEVPFVLESLSLPAPVQCELICWSVGCGGGGHWLQDGGNEAGGDDHGGACNFSHSCFSHECTVPVPTVAGTDTDSDLFLDPEFWRALESAPGETLRTFLANNEHAAWFNAERQAIQVRGCADMVIANIPLTSEQIEALECER